MAGGAKVTTATTAGRSAPRSRTAPSNFQSEVDAGSLYQLLENQIIPLYYAKPDGKLPLAWLQLMRESIRSVTPVFNTHRMVKEYTERLYIPAAKAHAGIRADGCAAATELSQWKAQMRKDWPQVRILDVQIGNADRQNILVGEALQISAQSSSRRGRSRTRARGSLSRRGRQRRDHEIPR